jgi:hypothetical protein
MNIRIIKKKWKRVNVVNVKNNSRNIDDGYIHSTTTVVICFKLTVIIMLYIWL